MNMNFNSTMVRLNRVLKYFLTVDLCHFNSTMVRLNHNVYKMYYNIYRISIPLWLD